MGLLNEPMAASDADSEVDSIEPDPSAVSTELPLERYLSPMATFWSRLISTHWRISFLHFINFLIPRFLQGRHAREQMYSSKLSPTAYLDGMRRLAPLFVYFCHYTYQGFNIAKSWGCGEANYEVFKLPLLCIWYQGPQAVCVFFVISGYALSYRPLQLIRGRALPEFSTAMSSLIFRRGLRLYLPTIISTFMIACLLRIGAYEWTRDFANDRSYMGNIVEPHPLRMDSTYAQFRDWVLHMYRSVHVFGWDKYGGSTSYDVHLWTIPVEFRRSLYLFLVLLGTARLQTKLRLLFVGVITWFTYRHSRWDFLLFLCGMLLAEWDLIRGAHAALPVLPQNKKRAEGPGQRLCKRCFWTALRICGLYPLCQPDDEGEVTPGWRRLTLMIPAWWEEEQFHYWQSEGAVLFVAAVGHSEDWQQFFNLLSVQYLGKISYALYLMHGPAMHTVGYHFERWAYSLTGVEGYWYNTGFALGACFCVPIVIWWADVFWRAIDVPSVKFAKWMEKKCVAKS